MHLGCVQALDSSKLKVADFMTKLKRLQIDGVTYEYDSSDAEGQGGGGIVWKARSLQDGKPYAIKRILKDKDKDSKRNKRFDGEVEYGRRTQHTHLIKIHGILSEERCVHYVMDYFPKTLRDVINDESDWKVLLKYACQLLSAVAQVHSDGIVHRDIKPENILVDPQQEILVLADFGIAHFKDSDITKHDELLVNRNYLAPEQMRRKNAKNIGKPADVFALGLVVNEMFTKQNARGKRHAAVCDFYPFLDDLDWILERMMLQDELARPSINTVYAYFRMIIQRLEDQTEQLLVKLAPDPDEIDRRHYEVHSVLERASRDVLAAKSIFEHGSIQDLGRYNYNYHCEISYDVDAGLFNICAQAMIYYLCRKKFENEASGGWDESDYDLVISDSKFELQQEFDALLNQFPLPQRSRWASLPLRSSRVFRFCKDYHCRELLTTVRESVLGNGPGSLKSRLIDAPILTIVQSLRESPGLESITSSLSLRSDLELDRHLRVNWLETSMWDSSRLKIGRELFIERLNSQYIDRALQLLEENWHASILERLEGDLTVIFSSREDFARFRDKALSSVSEGLVDKFDVEKLVRETASFEDLVVLSWSRDFDVFSVVCRVLGIRD